MATRKVRAKNRSRRSAADKSPSASPRDAGKSAAASAETSARSTVSGPARKGGQIGDAATAKISGVEAVAFAFPFNAAKSSEFGSGPPATGQVVEAPHPMSSGSTLSEVNASPKVGNNPQLSFNPANGPLDRVRLLAASGHALEFLKDHYRHCKPILLLGSAQGLLDKAGIPRALASGEVDPGLLCRGGEETDGALSAFIKALAKHRHFKRETDSPRI